MAPLVLHERVADQLVYADGTQHLGLIPLKAGHG